MIVRIARVKVGNRQAPYCETPALKSRGFCFSALPISESVVGSAPNKVLDTDRNLPHNHQFSTEGCPSG